MKPIIALEALGRDLRYALRTMRKSPGFTAVGVLSLALGIGANTAIFTFVNAALLKPLPYPDADRIVALQQRSLQGQGTTFVHPRSFVPWHDRAQSFEALAIAQAIPINTQGIDGAEQVSGLWTTSELFAVFGVGPFLGRVFTDQEGLNRSGVRGESAAGGTVAILSHGYWQRRFGSDPSVLGKTVPIGRGSAVVVGVMPAGFRVGTLNVDLYFPMPLDRNRPDAVGSRSFHCYGRLRPGITLQAAQGGDGGSRRSGRPGGPHRKGLGRSGTQLARLPCARQPDGAVTVARGGCLRPADRVRQPRGPAPGARHQPPKRAGSARIARREPWTDSSTASH